MILGKVLIFMALGVVVAKFVASLLGKGDVSWLNKLVTVILSLFISFELYQISQLLLAKM
ncbi:hypothetical protein VB715_02675 [Crocosphaera sp. UHCC 0190]|uniref:hypothetical protein n=1 Tax=Crocosphaera sp. UHCC 0190 TaxID=3110246 RepID=UPI002B1F30D6|nr:hypothetical protein [Crocosphaera sp. UHCC 0190]MEA5508660.1 hypothetical protein [Crocosphaera sp. UHCC 0190]